MSKPMPINKRRMQVGTGFYLWILTVVLPKETCLLALLSLSIMLLLNVVIGFGYCNQ